MSVQAETHKGDYTIRKKLPPAIIPGAAHTLL
jgi:hypothetical protein